MTEADIKDKTQRNKSEKEFLSNLHYVYGTTHHNKTQDEVEPKDRGTDRKHGTAAKLHEAMDIQSKLQFHEIRKFHVVFLVKRRNNLRRVTKEFAA